MSIHDREVPLLGGDVTPVVRVGATVRRPLRPWTMTVHALLRHLRDKGITQVPEPLGVDDQGREILTYIDGHPGLLPLEPDVRSDEALEGIAVLLRQIHEATRDFSAPADAVWQRHPGAAEDGDVICHNDLFPPNLIFNGTTPVGLIDWDFAASGTALFDVASAAKFWVPLTEEVRAQRDGWSTVDRGRRLRLLADAYGLPSQDRHRLLDAVLDKQQMGLRLHQERAAAGDSAFVAMVRQGSLDVIRADMDWLARTRDSLEHSLD